MKKTLIEPTVNRWDEIFQENGRVFNEPHPNMPSIAAKCHSRQLKKVLDLGCGSGRHLVYFAQQGFQAYGVDFSHTGLLLARQWLDSLALPARLHRQDMTQPLAFPANCFDALISIQVIHHGRLETIRSIVSEIERVLKPGGMVFVSVSMPKKRKARFKEVEPNTFLPLEGREKGLLHHFFSEDELRQVFCNFEIARVFVDSTRHICLEGNKKIKKNNT